jgi:hypothetical protein
MSRLRELLAGTRVPLDAVDTMIRYRISRVALIARIRRRAPGWLDEAKDRTATFRKLKRYSEPPPPSWSRLKAIYTAIQNRKCAYCERKLASHSIEHDLEHYRPKSRVRRWRARNDAANLGEDLACGYYLLAYDPLNYLVACKTCNTPYKSSYFPILGSRAKTTSAAALRKERAVLPYPLGSISDDPERIIGFFGIVPMAVADKGPRATRAKITIEFLGLDERDELNEERALMLTVVDLLLRSGDSSAKRMLRQLRSGTEGHTACVRSFLRLHATDPALAEQVIKVVKRYQLSHDYPLLEDALRVLRSRGLPRAKPRRQR